MIVMSVSSMLNTLYKKMGTVIELILRFCYVVIWLVFMLAPISVGAGLAGSDSMSGPARVISAGEIEISGIAFRLWGIEAPHLSQICYRGGKSWACGERAARHLQAFVKDKPVHCAIKDATARPMLARCHTQGLDLSAELATHGFAMVHPDGPQTYIHNHHDGRTHSTGMWSGLHVSPWEWRAGKRVTEWISDINGCAVKGVEASNGEKNYYLPGDEKYTSLRVLTQQGGRWFCSADEADKAGWTAAQ